MNRGVVWGTVVLVLWGAGCGGAEEPAPPADVVETALHWTPAPGAEDYRVRAWAGYRLLFEVEARDTTLAATAGMRRALATADTVVLEIQARAADGGVLETRRPRWKP